MTWQMACHALTNWATKSPSNSVAEFEYLRLSARDPAEVDAKLARSMGITLTVNTKVKGPNLGQVLIADTSSFSPFLQAALSCS